MMIRNHVIARRELLRISAGLGAGTCLCATRNARAIEVDNVLTPAEAAQGWQLLFDGKTLQGWMTSSGTPGKTPVEDGAINPHRCGGYMMVHEKKWEDFVLTVDFRISKGCNSGLFLRVASLTPRPGKDVGFNGIEVAIDDTNTAGYHDTGAIYDLVKPTRNAMKPPGEWNRMIVTSHRQLISVVLNGEPVTVMDCDEFPEPFRRPDGTAHKFDVAYRTHPRLGYFGFQDHGAPCWFKNIKLRPLPSGR